jgi:outer membrane lipoprotein-sorting protein
MRLKSKLIVAALLILILAYGRFAFAAAADDKDRVLRELDVAAKNFHSTSADFQFDSITTDPIPDDDVQKGTVYYQRRGKSVQMAAHIDQVNGKPVPKVYVYSDGVFKLYEKMINQVTTLNKLTQYESYLMLGFGASGKDLEEKWDIKYLGPDTLTDGKLSVKTEMLELVAKDLAIRKNLPKVTVWMDTVHGVNLKQVFDEGSGQSRVSVYFNIKVNQTLPADAFTLKTDSQTQFVTR